MDLAAAALAAIRRLAAAHPAVQALYVFGSRATGPARPDSDLDLGVLYDSAEPLSTTIGLEEDLCRATRLEVDLVDVSRSSPFLALEVVRGERIYCRDIDHADRFDLYVLRRAGDLLPFERKRRAQLLSPRR